MIWKFASRYFIAKKSTNAINVISWVSISAIAVGTASLIIVLSVFNGFEDLVKSLYSSFYPEIKITPVTGKTMVLSATLIDSIKVFPGINGISEIIQEKALLNYNNNHTIAVLMGVDSHFPEVTGIKSKMIRGKFDLGNADTPLCIVGAGIEANLGIDIQRSFYPITVYIPKRGIAAYSTPEDALNAGNINPVGTFAIQQDFDNTYVITNIDFIRQLGELNANEFSSIDMKLNESSKMNLIKKKLQYILGSKYLVQTRYEQNQSLYQVMQTEKWIVFAILTFILAIAAFNMIGSLYMLVMEKKQDIAILKAMGATSRLIRNIFLAEGLMIAGSGAVLGSFLALVICSLQKHFGFIKLQGGSFVIDAYPISIHFTDFILVFFTIIMISILASWYPASRASMQLLDLKSQ